MLFHPHAIIVLRDGSLLLIQQPHFTKTTAKNEKDQTYLITPVFPINNTKI